MLTCTLLTPLPAVPSEAVPVMARVPIVSIVPIVGLVIVTMGAVESTVPGVRATALWAAKLSPMIIVEANISPMTTNALEFFPILGYFLSLNFTSKKLCRILFMLTAVIS
jgi:hypothetical protein